MALKAYNKHRKPIALRGVPLARWSPIKALLRSAEDHLDELIRVGDPSARPKVSGESFFQYFNSRLEDRWRREWGLQPPAHSFQWHTDSSNQELKKLPRGETDRYGYWILQTNQLPSVSQALKQAQPSVRDLLASVWIGQPGPLGGAPLEGHSEGVSIPALYI